MKLGDFVIFNEGECLVTYIGAKHNEESPEPCNVIHLTPFYPCLDVGNGPGKMVEINANNPIVSTIIHIPQLL